MSTKRAGAEFLTRGTNGLVAWVPVKALRTVARLAKRHPLGAFGAGIIALVTFAAVFAPLLAPYDPVATRQGPTLTGPSVDFIFGTDHLGRDLFSRVIFGSRISLMVGMLVVALGTSSALIIGMISGYFGGKIDMVLQRLVDTIMALPGLVLALAIVTALGPGVVNTMIALSIIVTPGQARIIRSQVLALREVAYVESARAVGASDVRILTRHILPNVLPLVVILASTLIGGAILAEASLSFLGLGVQAPEPSWGEMTARSGRQYMLEYKLLPIFPGVAITLVVLAYNLVGDAVRDEWDPRLRS